MRRSAPVARLLAFALALLVAPQAVAVPAFGRKTGLACSACHQVWPRLNDFGQQFRDNGYRLKRGRDAPVEQDPSFWPISMRTTVGYHWLRQNLVATDRGPVTTTTGTIGFTGLDVFAAGTLGERVSFLVTYTPGLASAGFGLSPQDGNLETAFVGIHDLLGTWLNVRVGKHAPDLPEDEHRTITLTQGYNTLHAAPFNTRVAFQPGNNQGGVEVYGHSELSRLRYSASLLNAGGAPLSNSFLSSPVVWGHLQASHLLDNPVLAEVKVGVFGAVGWQPTAFEVRTDPGAPSGAPPAPVSGTGHNHSAYQRYGGELHLYFLSNIYPLTMTGVLMGGSDDASLVEAGETPAKFIGGWGELSWTPTIHLTVLGRVERIRTTNPGVAALESPLPGDRTVLVGVIRHTFEVSSRTEAAVQVELSHARLAQPPDAAETPTVTTALFGLDLAF